MNYRTKAIDSFRAKMNLFIYSIVRNGQNEFRLSEFQQFKISEDLVLEYTSIYYQEEVDCRINGIPIDSIYKSIIRFSTENKEEIEKAKSDYINCVFPLIFSKDKFVEITSKTTCCYCGISKDEIEKLAQNKKLFKKNMRGWSLELDRFNSNYEYLADNCDMACYWCNNAKTDEFSKEEFEEIGKAIKQVWKTRMSKEQ